MEQPDSSSSREKMSCCLRKKYHIFEPHLLKFPLVVGVTLSRLIEIKSVVGDAY